MKSLYVITCVLFFSCTSTNPYYQGRVIDEKAYPIEGAIVTELYQKKAAATDKNGYFKLSKHANWIDDLVFTKPGYETDTIPSVWHQGGETTRYNFITNDTRVVVLRKIR